MLTLVPRPDGIEQIVLVDAIVFVVVVVVNVVEVVVVVVVWSLLFLSNCLNKSLILALVPPNGSE